MNQSIVHFFNENQIIFIGLGGAIGIVTTTFLLIFVRSDRAWKIADLLWIAAGGISALFAVLSSIFLSDHYEISRKVDISIANLARFNRPVVAFHANWCIAVPNTPKIPLSDDALGILCSAAFVYGKETRENSGLFELANALGKSVVGVKNRNT